MSRYLIDRIGALSNVTLHMQTQVVGIEHERGSITAVRSRRPEGEDVLKTSHLFFFTGATPNTGWLGNGEVMTDEKGFVLTGPALRARTGLVRASLETSVPGCSRLATCGPVRSSGLRPLPGKAQLSSPMFTNFWPRREIELATCMDMQACERTDFRTTAGGEVDCAEGGGYMPAGFSH